MISRVTSSAVNSTLASQINKRYADYAKLTNQITTGKRVNSLMDDTIESVNIINSNRQLTRIGVLGANVSSIANEIKDSSETIEKVIDKAQRAKDLATTAANGTSTKSTIKASLSELDQIIETVVNLANTNYNGNYLYGGTNTKTSACGFVGYHISKPHRCGYPSLSSNNFKKAVLPFRSSSKVLYILASPAFVQQYAHSKSHKISASNFKTAQFTSGLSNLNL